MNPVQYSPPHQHETYQETDRVSQQSGYRWQTVEPRQRLCVKSTAAPKTRVERSSRSGAQSVVRAAVARPQEALLQKGFDQLRKAPGDSLTIARQLLNMYPSTDGYDLEARALVELGRHQECLAILDQLPAHQKSLIRLRKIRGRALADLRRFDEAETELRDLYENSSRTPKQIKTNGLALGRILERMGGKKQQEALQVFTHVRQCLATQPDSPCDDPEVELTLARHLQKRGGRVHLCCALNILTHLRQKKAGNRANTPCDDQKVEIALARVLQDMGGKNVQTAHTIWVNLHQRRPGHRECALGLAISLNQLANPQSRREGLTLITALRQRIAGNKVDTACDDKEVELTLARLLQNIGGSGNTGQALAILLRLRQRASRGEPDRPCDDRAIELALGAIGNWRAATTTSRKL